MEDYLLNIISGITKMDSGEIIGLMKIYLLFQEDRLMEWKNINDNMDLLKNKMDKRQRKHR